MKRVKTSWTYSTQYTIILPALEIVQNNASVSAQPKFEEINLVLLFLSVGNHSVIYINVLQN